MSVSSRISVAHYTPAELHEQFHSLYSSFDFQAESKALKVPWWQYRQRRKTRQEFKALTIALWGIALQKSFSDQAKEIFDSYKKTEYFLSGPETATQHFSDRVNIYSDLLKNKRDTDFLPVAKYIATLFSSPQDEARIQLRLSLVIRTLYNIIFDNLV